MIGMLAMALIMTTAQGPDRGSQSEQRATDTARVAPIRSPVSAQRSVVRAPSIDKYQHAAMSYAITTFAYAGARSIDADNSTSLAIGVGTAAIAGVGKELYDRAHGGRVSWFDLLADVVGIAGAYFVLRQVR